MSFIKKWFGSKEEPVKNYAEFWNWFIQNQKEFHSIVKDGKKIQSHFFKKLSPKLDELREGFFFVTGMFDDETAELIITADGNIRNIVFVEEIIVAAPKIEGWKFTALKPPTNIENVGIEMNGCTFDKNNLSFFSTTNPDSPDEIDITIVYDNTKGNDIKTINIGSLLFIDNFLGELNSVTLIDTIKVIEKKDTNDDLIPIEKLNDFLIWREKEFIEKYESIKHDSENDNFVILEAKLKNGKPIIAMMNSDLLKWEEKASYQWFLTIELKFDGSQNNGLPNNETMQLYNEFEDDLLEYLTDKNGNLNIGRETVDGTRTIYFACKDFRIPSKTMAEFKTKYSNKINFDFDLYKDKYWLTLKYYIESVN